MPRGKYTRNNKIPLDPRQVLIDLTELKSVVNLCKKYNCSRSSFDDYCSRHKIKFLREIKWKLSKYA